MNLEMAGESTGGSMDLSVQERRKYQRIACEGNAEAVILGHEALFRGHIRDISEGGCYIETPATMHVAPGMEIDLRFILKDNHFHFEAMVMNVRDGCGFGLRFLTDGDGTKAGVLRCLIRFLIDHEQVTL